MHWQHPYPPRCGQTFALCLPAHHTAFVHLQGLEKYLMTKIHGKVFAQSALDRERDEALGQRMAALSFVRPEHLDIPAVYQDEKVTTAYTRIEFCGIHSIRCTATLCV